jgi:hypothetical protein
VLRAVHAHETIIAAITDSVQAAAGQLARHPKEPRHPIDVQNKHGLHPMQQSVKLAMAHQGCI